MAKGQGGRIIPQGLIKLFGIDEAIRMANVFQDPPSSGKPVSDRVKRLREKNKKRPLNQLTRVLGNYSYHGYSSYRTKSAAEDRLNELHGIGKKAFIEEVPARKPQPWVIFLRDLK